MRKPKFETPDLTSENIEKIAALFPNCITEMPDEERSTPEKKVYKRAINFELLKQMLSPDVVDGDEAYEFTWVGKKAAIVEANKPIRKTLRPCVAESKDWDTTENLYIEGDNLEVLKLLQESYLGKVKMIYIDPPYNTGNDFIYADDFKMESEEWKVESGEWSEEGDRLFKNTDSNGRFHSDWCSMIYSRLMLARNLLTDDGVIFVSINDKEINTLRSICAEIFGESNFLATLVWDKNHSAQAGIFKVYHEYVVVYCKNSDLISTPKSLNHDLFEAGAMKKVSGRHPATEFVFPAGTRFDAPDGTVFTGEYGDTEKVIITKGRMIAKNGVLQEEVTLKAGFTQANQMKQYFYGDRSTLVDSQGQRIVEFYFNSTGKIKVIKERGVESPQTTCHFGTQGAATTELAALFEMDEAPFSAPKPVGMIKDFILRFVNHGDTVLDFFSGSGTTAQAVYEANASRDTKHIKYILVQVPENIDKSLKNAQKDAVRTLEVAIEYLEKVHKPHTICEIGKERIRRAGQKILKEQLANNNSTLNSPNSKLDIGFRVLKLDSTNMKDVYYAPCDYDQDFLHQLKSNIKDDRTDLDLLFGCLIDWGLPLSLPYKSEQLGGCTVHTYNDGDLIACFDANVPESVVKEIAQRKPLRAVFRDSGFASSPEKINMFEIFKLYMPEDAGDITKCVRVI